MRIRLAVSAALTVSSSAALATAQRDAAVPLALAPGAQRWVATTGVATPWIFDLVIADTSVTGAVRQRSIGSIPFSQPFDVRDGRMRGDTISFTLLYNEGDRVITFVATRRGDSLDFTRTVHVVRGYEGATGVLGADGAARFIARRFAAETPIPAAAVLTEQQATSAARPQQNLHYKGFTVNYSAIASHADKDSVLAAVRVQLDVVLAAVPSDETRAFFASVPLEVVPASGTAQYGGGRVVISEHPTAPLDAAHPVLLHELLHAYHDQRVPNGVRNEDLLALYQEAIHSGRFPADSYMLSRPGEYFAMMASVYLAGSAAREPFARDSIKLKQPAMYAWLRKEFGPR